MMVAGLLGHSRPETAAHIYIHPSETVRAEGPQAIANMLFKEKGRDKVESYPAPLHSVSPANLPLSA